MSLQRDVARFVAEADVECDPAHRLLDLVSEVGEVAKEILTASDYGGSKLSLTRDLSEELGDAAFSLYALADRMGLDLDDATRAAMRKYAQRLADKGCVASGR
jgi:NTP pyrophosphatase (non-canonical NTP hydrolase)